MGRKFRTRAPNTLLVSEYTFAATWRGFAYVAFAIDAYARRALGWRVSAAVNAGFVLDALEQAFRDRRRAEGRVLIHCPDRGSQYLSIR